MPELDTINRARRTQEVGLEQIEFWKQATVLASRYRSGLLKIRDHAYAAFGNTVEVDLGDGVMELDEFIDKLLKT